jgi:FAD:protein FMN transferase
MQKSSLRIGLEHPDNVKQVIGVATITNQAICGSSGNRRQWGEFHHIIHPTLLSSPRHMLATWVVADTAIVADAIATCLYFTSPALLQQHFDFEYLLLLPDYSIDQSFAFPAEVFYNENHNWIC